MSGFADELKTGWRSLLAAVVGLGLGIGLYMPISSLFFRSLEQDFGWSKSIAAGALIALPITAFVLPLAGKIIDRLGVRLTAGVSVLLMSASYVFLATFDGSVVAFYIGLIALNVLGCATGPIAYTRLIATEFRRARGTALAISLFGIALFSIIVPPVIGLIIADYGWRAAYLFLAGAALVGGGVAQLLMQEKRAQSSATASAIPHLRNLVSNPGFWVLGFAILALATAAMGFVAQFQSVMVEEGIGPAEATGYLSLLSLAVVVSRLVVGRLLDLQWPNRWAAGMICLSSIGMFMLSQDFSGPGLLAMAVILIGVSLGAELDLLSFFCAKLFGLQAYASNYGMLSIFFYMGMGLGGFGYGLAHDVAGSYDLAQLIAIGLLLISGALILSLGRFEPAEPDTQ